MCKIKTRAVSAEFMSTSVCDCVQALMDRWMSRQTDGHTGRMDDRGKDIFGVSFVSLLHPLVDSCKITSYFVEQDRLPQCVSTLSSCHDV